ncbi:MAG TPA: DUF928 domain-containing protein [Candidatus Binatia bacterium]|nr:DUF928 domain-containing protein [Candidatus Binatia bacterium]
MKNVMTILAVGLVTGLLFGLPMNGFSQDSKTSKPSDQNLKDQGKITTASVPPVYTPPQRGAPGGRVGGGTRGTQREVFVLSVLAPDHSGFTTKEQPSLYWFISNPTSLPVEITVMDPKGVEPILETRLPSPVKAGVNRIRLSDFDVRLAPGGAYRWFVSVVPDSDRRSKDIMAGGAIERVEMPEGLKAKLAQAEKSELPSIYAEAGIWYDTVAAISELIEAAPQDQALRDQRTALLKQVGLTGIAE